MAILDTANKFWEIYVWFYTSSEKCLLPTPSSKINHNFHLNVCAQPGVDPGGGMVVWSSSSLLLLDNMVNFFKDTLAVPLPCDPRYLGHLQNLGSRYWAQIMGGGGRREGIRTGKQMYEGGSRPSLSSANLGIGLTLELLLSMDDWCLLILGVGTNSRSVNWGGGGPQQPITDQGLGGWG